MNYLVGVMRRIIFSSVLAFGFLSLQAQNNSTLIRNVQLIDGMGLPARQADVRIKGNLIEAIGKLKVLPGETLSLIHI